MKRLFQYPRLNEDDKLPLILQRGGRGKGSERRSSDQTMTGLEIAAAYSSVTGRSHMTCQKEREKTVVKLRKRCAVLLLMGLFVAHAFAVEAQELTRLYLGTPTHSLSWFPLFVAMKRGFFREQGLSLEPIIMQPRVTVSALVTKEISYSSTINSVFGGAAQGLPIKVIMVVAAKSSFVLMARPGIGSPQELRGRNIAITQAGSATHRQLLLVLKKFGITPTEVNVVGLGDHSNRVIALRRGHVDAALLSVPYDLPLEKDGFKRLIFFKDVMDFPVSGLATHDDRIREKRNEIKGVLAAVLKGIAYTKTNREEMLPQIKEFVRLESLEMAAKAYETFRDIWADDGTASDEGLRVAVAEAGASPALSMDKLANWSVLKEALASIKR